MEGGEEWWRSGWRNREEGRVNREVDEELVSGVEESVRGGVVEERMEE